MSDGEMAVLDRLIKELEDRLLKYKALREFAEEDPTLLTQLTERVRSPEANGKIKSHPAGKELGDIVFDLNPNATKIINFLKSKPVDEWVQVFDIVQATQLKSANINSYLNNGISNLVESKPVGRKNRFWRLLPAVRSVSASAVK